MTALLRILMALALTVALASAQHHRRNLRVCECSCLLGNGDYGVGVVLLDSGLIVDNDGKDNACVLSEKAAEYFQDVAAKCDDKCDYTIDQVEEASSSDVDLDALDF